MCVMDDDTVDERRQASKKLIIDTNADTDTDTGIAEEAKKHKQ